MTLLRITVHGVVGAQGSKRHVGGGVMVESSKAVKPWRQDVTAAAIEAAERQGWEPLRIPTFVRITFIFARPKSHYRTGARASELRPDAPTTVITAPDIDKCLRSTFDALTTAGVIPDDRYIAGVTAQKVYAGNYDGQLLRPGAVITVSEDPRRES